MPKRAQASNADWRMSAAESTASGRGTKDRSSTASTNPTMNRGTTAGRATAADALPDAPRSPAEDRRRVWIDAIATIGASISTRVSLTTTATARAAAPAVCAVATT